MPHRPTPPRLALGVRIISPDRPGMGRSTFQPDRRLLDWPARRGGADRRARHRSVRRHGLVVRWAVRRSLRAPACAMRVTAVGLLSSAVPFELFGTTQGSLQRRPDPALPGAPGSLAGLRPPACLDRRCHRDTPLPGDPPHLSRRRPGGPRRAGLDRRRGGLRQGVDAPGHGGMPAGLPGLRRSLGLRPRRGHGAGPHLGGSRGPHRSTRVPGAPASSPPRRPSSPSSPARVTSPCCSTRPRDLAD